MKILFTGKNHSQGLKEQDPTSLASIAQANGFDLVSSISEKPNLVICVDYEKSALSVVRHARSKGIKTVLVANEPQVVIPQHAQSRIRKEFDKILEVGRPWANPLLRWPQTWRTVSEKKERLDRVILVNADKWSFVRGQLYWLRAAAASRLEAVDVFGFGWQRTLLQRVPHRVFELLRTISSRSLPCLEGIVFVIAKPRAYKGSVSDKITAMSDYKVALVVENSSELLTEKLFDAWFAGCIPVYLGPPLEAFYLPTNLAIQVKHPTLPALRQAIDLALSLDYGVFTTELRVFLESDLTYHWMAPLALEDILKAATD